MVNGEIVGSAGVSPNDAYLKEFLKKSNSITSQTVSFVESTLRSTNTTSENDFVFFINGQYMEHDALEIQQVGATFRLKVDTDSIGYDLESDDEIIAHGKFNS